MAQRLPKHGSEAGYNAERTIGNICDRCRAAHRVWSRRKGQKGKSEGLGKYTSYDVIDHLDLRAKRPPRTARTTPQTASALPGPRARNGTTAAPSETTDLPAMPQTASAPPEPSLGDRLAERIRELTIGGPSEPEYVEENETGYVYEIEDTDEPGPEWEPAEDDEFVINAKSLDTIQENLATYLSVLGITVELIDPFCGPILAENLDNIVKHWSKVIAHYPKAAQLFLDGKGGIIFTWISALQATWPVLYAVYQHHLAKTVTVHNGRIYNKRSGPVTPDFDATMPPMQPEYQYSAT
jgi:hypothetical protein